MNSEETAKAILSNHLKVLKHHFPNADSYNLLTAAKKTAILEVNAVMIIGAADDVSGIFVDRCTEMKNHIEKL